MTNNTPTVVARNLGSMLDFRRAARLAAGEYPGCPVAVVPGNAAPTVQGDRQYYTTPGGDYCPHPNAYTAAGGGWCTYHPSTLAVVVGRGWTPPAGW